MLKVLLLMHPTLPRHGEPHFSDNSSTFSPTHSPPALFLTEWLHCNLTVLICRLSPHWASPLAVGQLAKLLPSGVARTLACSEQTHTHTHSLSLSLSLAWPYATCGPSRQWQSTSGQGRPRRKGEKRRQSRRLPLKRLHKVHNGAANEYQTH